MTLRSDEDMIVERLCEFITETLLTINAPPTCTEMQTALGIGRARTRHYLRLLESQGRMTWNGRDTWTIRVCDLEATPIKPLWPHEDRWRQGNVRR